MRTAAVRADAPTAMQDDSAVRRMAREAIRAGTLPGELPRRPRGGRGTGAIGEGGLPQRMNGGTIFSKTGCTYVLTTSPRDVLR